MSKFKNFLKKKDIEFSAKRYFIDAMGAMALGLFASLLIATIFKTIGGYIPGAVGKFLIETAGYATAVSGAVIGVAVANALKAPPLVMYCAGAVGYAGYAIGDTFTIGGVKKHLPQVLQVLLSQSLWQLSLESSFQRKPRSTSS